MKVNNLFTVFSFFLLSISACNEAQQGSSQTAESTQEVRVLSDFESRSALNIWSGPVSLSNEFSAHGKSSLKLYSLEGRSLWLESEKPPKDRSACDYLKFNIYNSSSCLYYGYINICDELGSEQNVKIQSELSLTSTIAHNQ